MAQPATLARLARHEPRREDASHDGFQLAPEPADAERRAQITTRVEDGPALLLGDAPAARERRATEPRSSRASGGRHQSVCSVWHSWVQDTCVVKEILAVLLPYLDSDSTTMVPTGLVQTYLRYLRYRKATVGNVRAVGNGTSLYKLVL